MNRNAKKFVKFAMHTNRYMYACNIEGPIFSPMCFESCMEHIQNSVPHAIEIAEFYETVATPAMVEKLRNRIIKAAKQGGREYTRSRLAYIDQQACRACREWQCVPDSERVPSLALILTEGDWQSNIERAAHLDAMAMKIRTSLSQIFPRPIPQ